jgi:hypothetical protein
MRSYLCAIRSYGGGGGGTSPLILNLGTSWRTGNFAPRLPYPQERTHVLTKWEVGWAPEPVWTIWRRVQPCPADSLPGSYSTGVTEQNYERTEACVGHLVVYLSL